MQRLNLALKSSPIVYVTRDSERALGLPLNIQSYYIITNENSFAKRLAKKYRNLFLVKAKEKLDTRELLERQEVIKFINNLPAQNILVFKNTLAIEKICTAHEWNLLNPSAELATRVEEKITQLKWLGPLKKYLPPTKLTVGEKLEFKERPYIVQFNRAHTGSGTILVDSKKIANEIKNKFPKREMRATKFVSGPALTNNNVVWGKKILLGNINYQITGMSPFTTLPFSTVGNDWALPQEILSKKQLREYFGICAAVGKQLAKNGWKGLFGVDAICDENSPTGEGKIYLIEINARQPASTTYESQLQIAGGTKKEKKITTFEAHLSAVIGLKYAGEKLITIKDGAQIIKRLHPNEKMNQKKIAAKLAQQGFNVVTYDTNEPEKDFLRIQSPFGIMAEHNEFNALGQNIVQQII